GRITLALSDGARGVRRDDAAQHRRDHRCRDGHPDGRQLEAGAQDRREGRGWPEGVRRSAAPRADRTGADAQPAPQHPSRQRAPPRPTQFPEVYEAYTELCTTLGIHEPPELYVV